jgi:tRNA (guanine-N7-)-methyltransferase
VSRPSIRRALKRSGAVMPPRPPRTGPRNLGRVPPPKIFLPGESAEAGVVDFSAIFGRKAPVEMEIGVGKGRFLLAAAAADRERDFFGLEIEAEYAAIVRVRAERAGLTNLRVERLDGKAFVHARLAPGSLAALHVYFPDPWPKKRHHKRRLVDPEWAAAAARALEPGGLLRVASDHAEYWSVIDAVLSAEPLLARLSEEEAGEWSTGTNYELKFLRSGRPIRKAVFRRVTSPASAPSPAAA